MALEINPTTIALEMLEFGKVRRVYQKAKWNVDI